MLTAVERVLILKGADLLNDASGRATYLRLAEVADEVEIWKGDTIYRRTISRTASTWSWKDECVSRPARKRRRK